MNAGDHVIYSLEVTGVPADRTSKVEKDLKKVGVPLGSQVWSRSATAAPVLRVVRLFTNWRGNDEEMAWQSSVVDAVGSLGVVSISAKPWKPLPGYPKVTEGWDEPQEVLL